MKRPSDLWASLLPIGVAGLLLVFAPRFPWLAPTGQPSPALLLLLIAAGVAGAAHRPLKGETLGLGTIVLPPALLLSGAGPTAALAASCFVLAELGLRLLRRKSVPKSADRRGLLRILESAGRATLATLGAGAAWAAVRFLWGPVGSFTFAAFFYLLLWIGLEIADRKVRRPEQPLRPLTVLPPFALDALGWALGGVVALTASTGIAAALLAGLAILVLEAARNAFLLERASHRIHDLERLGRAGDRLGEKEAELVQLVERIRDESAKVLPYHWYHFEALAPGWELRSWWSGREGELEEGVPDLGNYAPVIPGFHRRTAWQIVERQLRAFGRIVARVRFWCDPRRLDPKSIDLLDLLIPQASLSVQRCFAGKEAQEDPLTGALLRRALEPRLNQAYGRVCERGGAMSVILCDIDHFKRINDTYGHVAGDRALVAVSGVLKSSRRDGDLCCRYGGEEFLLLIDGSGGEDALAMAERLRRSVEELPFEVDCQRVPLTMSAGVASFPDLYIKSAAELILFADEALYEAKGRGRNRVLLDIGQGKYLDVEGNVLVSAETSTVQEPPRIFA
ncbi:MAG TPA: GGDEF domain-containing protein [Thermoanaerobaculia bacterium]|nr:GGDEF domain-containing protein [Thermoanaerobaculia bacterium]